MSGDTRGPMARALGTALAAIPEAAKDKRDEAALQLARRYAALIDNAAPGKVYARHLRALREMQATMRVENIEVFGIDTDKAIEEIEVALAAHTVASDLGPKLLAALTALGLTPVARGVAAEGKGQGGGTTATDQLRAKREQRARGAGAS